MNRAFRFLISIALLGVAFLGGYLYNRWSLSRGKGTATAGRKILYYVDAMHPWYKSDKPGIAPDCGMKLVAVYADGGAAPVDAASNRKILRYRDPKQTSYTSNEPGINPETGNDLEPVYASNTETPPGSIQIDAGRQQLMGIRYGVVELIPGAGTIRASGKVTRDETRVTRVHSKVEGWIEQVFVSFTGDLVRKGQQLLTLYSPELLASRDVMSHSSMPEAAVNAQALAAASRRRLELLDIPAARIEELEKTGKPNKSIPVYSPASGFVIVRNAFTSQRVTTETELYQIADLSRVWIMADVFESDSSHIRIGQVARVTSPGSEAAPLSARVSYIQPEVDPVVGVDPMHADPRPGDRCRRPRRPERTDAHPA